MTKEELYKIIELLIKSNLSEDSNDRLEILKEISISLNRIANELEISVDRKEGKDPWSTDPYDVV